jgi:hypothetical protein
MTDVQNALKKLNKLMIEEARMDQDGDGFGQFRGSRGRVVQQRTMH